MSWADLWSYVSHIEVGLSLLLGVPALVFTNRGDLQEVAISSADDCHRRPGPPAASLQPRSSPTVDSALKSSRRRDARETR